jgi:hypothetical protein
MSAPDILLTLEGMGLHISVRDGKLLAQPRSSLTHETRGLIRAHKAELVECLRRTHEPPAAPMSSLSMEALKRFELDPTLLRAVVTDTDSNPDAAIVVVAVRGVGVGEILVPRDKYDGISLLAMIERMSSNSTLH